MIFLYDCFRLLVLRLLVRLLVYLVYLVDLSSDRFDDILRIFDDIFLIFPLRLLDLVYLVDLSSDRFDDMLRIFDDVGFRLLLLIDRDVARCSGKSLENEARRRR